MKNNLMLTLLVAVVVGGAAFFGGMKYQQSMRNDSQRATGIRTGGNGMRPSTGKIISQDDKSLTIQLADGSSKIILLSEKARIEKTQNATKGELKTGETVAVFGTANSDGSITAQSIQINPQFNRNAKAPNTAAKSPDAKEIVIEGKNYSFSPTEITVKKGEKTRVVFKNVGGMHDFRVDELNIATAVIGNGQEDFVEFTPDKNGTFEFYCSVGSHRMMGMKGTITVE